MDFQAKEDDPLETALATAFTESPILASRPPPPPYPAEPAQAQTPERTGDDGGNDNDNDNDAAWKEEYEQHLSQWRTESAAVREKAEQERERWRLVREREQMQEAERETAAAAAGNAQEGAVQRKDSEWETVTRSSSMREPADSPPMSADGPSPAKVAAAPVHDAPRRASHVPADSRDLISGQTSSRGHGGNPIQNPPSVPAPHSNTDDHGLSSSRTWEEVPSDDSSFPSLSFPERSAAASPDLRDRPLYQRPPAPPSVTLAIFDSSLSRRARILALISSIGINLVLPFVNGVMLGFGEIFAKNVVSFFGWNTGTAVGIRAAPRKR